MRVMPLEANPSPNNMTPYFQYINMAVMRTSDMGATPAPHNLCPGSLCGVRC